MGYSDKWKSVLDRIKEFHELSGGNVWYRGVNNSKYELHSGLFRLNSASSSLSEYLELERQLYMYYKHLGYLLHKTESGWGLLYSMQHHGVKTRLLDWTESLSVALYFACQGWTTQPFARLWMLNPTKLNKISLRRSEILSPTQSKYQYPDSFAGNISSFAIYPFRNNERIFAQLGCFTVQGNSLLPLDKEFDEELVKQQGIDCIDLGIEIKTEIVEFLRQNGINRFSLMPDLDGLSQYVNEIHIPPAWLR